MSINLESAVKVGILDSSNFYKSIEKIAKDLGIVLLCYKGIVDLGLVNCRGAFKNYSLNE